MITQLGIELGISRSTVAAVLSQQPGAKLRPETRKRVLATARRLEYRPHRYAQIMRKGRSGIVGMIQFGGVMQFGTQRALYVAKAINASGFELLSSDVLWHHKGVSAACTAMLDARVEGVLLVSPYLTELELERFRKAKIPIVSLSGMRLTGIPQVVADVRQGVFDLTRHLFRLGHRHLTLLTGSLNKTQAETRFWPSMERIRGFREAVEKEGGHVDFAARSPVTTRLDGEARGVIVCEGNADFWIDPYRIGEVAMSKLLRNGQRPDAALCSNDDWALGALAACADAGVRVPEDMAVTGFDNSIFSNYGTTRLTTVAQPIETMAQRAVDILVGMIRGEIAHAKNLLVKMPCKLMVRQSCGASARQPET